MSGMANRAAWLTAYAVSRSQVAFRKLNDLGRAARAAPRSIHYTTGAAVTLVPVLARNLLHDPFIGTRFPLVVFCPGIFVAAWLGGFGPGLVATIVSTVWADYLWFEHPYIFQVNDISEAIALAFLVVTGGLISLFVEMFIQAQLLADRRASESSERAAQLQTFINYAPIGIGLFDRELRYLDLNERAAQADGIPKHEHLGKTPGELLPAIGPRVEELLRHVRDTGEPILGLDVAGETPAARGQQRHWIANYYPALIENGRVVEIAAVALEITERKRAEEEPAAAIRLAQAAQAEAERANETKDRFLAMVSHELRSPLQAIIGAAQVLRSRFMPREAETFLSLIERNTRLEARLVHDLVDMARISAGKLSVDLQTTYLRSTVEMVIDSMQLRLDEKRISIQFEKLGPDRLVLGDPERLQQIVSNLLSNAVKFTNDGGWINVCLDRENSSQVELRVSDSGIGMDDKLIADVFTPFRQGDTGQRRSGLGLGLAIVKSLVELHGGTVQAYSEGVGKGSTFVVRVPVAEAADAVQFDTAVV
jgi:PAS domain S-box-containing protein